MRFDPTKPVMPTCGGEAIIHSTSGPYITKTGVKMPIIASIKPTDYLWELSYFRADGGFCADGSKHRFDLINIPEEKWRNFHPEEINGPTLIRHKDRPNDWVLVCARIGGRVKMGLVNSDLSSEEKILADGCKNPKPETHEVSFDLGKTWQPAGVKIQ